MAGRRVDSDRPTKARDIDSATLVASPSNSVTPTEFRCVRDSKGCIDVYTGKFLILTWPPEPSASLAQSM